MLDNSFTSITSINKDLNYLIAVNSLSKNMGMSGWRIGYVIANEKTIIQVLKLNQHLITCAPTILQLYMAKYFDEIIKVTIPQVKEVVEKRNRILEVIKDLKLSYMPGGATFYFMISINGFKGDGYNFALYLLLKHHIAVVPGSAYGEKTNEFIRIGIGTESEEKIIEALKVIKDLINTKGINADKVKKLMSLEGLKYNEN